MDEKYHNFNDRKSRRDFIKISAIAGIGAVLGKTFLTESLIGQQKLTSEPVSFKVPPMEKVRLGFVGVGLQGSNHMRNLMQIEGVEIKAVCDVVEEKVIRWQQTLEKEGRQKPSGYSKGITDFKRMCENEELDLVYTATPWEWHVPVAVAAMETGKNVAIEVPAAVTIDECWQLVEMSEKMKKHCCIMENCCYNRFELMTLNLVSKGLLGEILNAECGYLHDLRGIKFENRNEGLWRRAHSIKRNGNLYPTHGLGPTAQCMNINRGDRFDYLVSMSSPSKGLQLYAKKNFKPNDPRYNEEYKLGDVNTSIIKTVQGKTITIIHDTNLPRPYSRINLIQGTHGIVMGYPDALVYVEGKSKADVWDKADDWYKEYENPLWKSIGGKGAGHGGMDFIEDYRLIKCLREGIPVDIDVYDAAAWSVVSELSEISVANKSKPVDFPDFTRGAWKTRKPLGIVGA